MQANVGRQSPVRVLIVEDNWITAEGLKAILAGQVEVVGTASSVRSALDQLERLAPDLVLMDLRLPLEDDDATPDATFGLAAIAQIKQRVPESRVLVLSEMFAEHDADPAGLLAQAIRAGADGGMAKDDAVHKKKGSSLVDAIQTVMSGVPYYGPAVAKIMWDRFKKTESGGTPALTDAQYERLKEDISGKTNQHGDPKIVQAWRDLPYPVDLFD